MLTVFRVIWPRARLLGGIKPVVYSVNVDWFKVLNGLNRAGDVVQKIADEIDGTYPTLLGGKQ